MPTTLIIDGKTTTISGVIASIAITTVPVPIPIPPPVLTRTIAVGPVQAIKTLTAAAAAAQANDTFLVDPSVVYHEAVWFRLPVTLRSASPTKRVVVDVTGLPLPNDSAALLFDQNYTVDGFEIFGAKGVNSTNAASIRNNASISGTVGTIRNCNLHHSQNCVLHTGGVLVVDNSDLHHNTGDNQAHLLYHAKFNANVPTLTTVTNSRLWHCANGNCLKSNAAVSSITANTIGTVAVAAGTSINRPGDSGDPAWMTPLPLTPANSEWLIYHTDCSSNGYPYDGKAIDLPYGGTYSILNNQIFSGGSSGYLIGVGFEGVGAGVQGGVVKGNTFYQERGTCYIGLRVPNSVMFIDSNTFVGAYLPPPTILEATGAGAKIVATNNTGRPDVVMIGV